MLGRAAMTHVMLQDKENRGHRSGHLASNLIRFCAAYPPRVDSGKRRTHTRGARKWGHPNAVCEVQEVRPAVARRDGLFGLLRVDPPQQQTLTNTHIRSRTDEQLSAPR